LTVPPGPGPHDPANPNDGSQGPYGSPAPGGPPPFPGGQPYPGAQPYQTGQPYPTGQTYPGAAYGAPAYYPKNNLAVWSLVLGIAAFVLSCGLFTGIPAVIVGNSAKRAVAEGQANNDGMATAGIILGWVAIGLSVVGLVLLLAFLPAFLAWVETIPDQTAY
jgi:hypothetical protein